MAFFRRKNKVAKESPVPRAPVEDAKCRALLKAARLGNMSKIATLLEDPGVDINWVDEAGNHCLLHVVSGKRVDVAYMLLTSSVDPTLQNKNQKSALHLAAESNHQEMFRVILQSLSVRFRDRRGALVAAANAADADGMTALMHTVRNGNLELTAKLLEAGGLAEVRNKRLESPLILAAKRGPLPLAELLIHAKGELESRDENGSTPLMLASKAGHVSVVNLLLEHGARVDQVDRAGNTALLVGSQANHPAVTQRLIEGGADVQHKNKKQQTAISLSAQSSPRPPPGTWTQPMRTPPVRPPRVSQRQKRTVREVLVESGASDKALASPNALFLIACLVASIFAFCVLR